MAVTTGCIPLIVNQREWLSIPWQTEVNTKSILASIKDVSNQSGPKNFLKKSWILIHPANKGVRIKC